MEGQDSNMDLERPYPILFIPKVCTPLETNCELSKNVFLHLNILSSDEEGNETVIYSGLCNVKVVEGNDININYNSPSCYSNNEVPVILTEANQLTLPAYNDSQDQVWIDPATSPYVYNRCDSPPLETYTIQESHDKTVTIEQHNTYITQNVFNYNEDMEAITIQDSPPVIEEQKNVKKIPEIVQNSDLFNMYGEDEFECGVFLSQMSEEIINEARDGRKFVGLQTDNEALKQLMSTDIQSYSKQQKTILFLGHDSKSGQTVQNIAINDPSMECNIGAGEVESEVIIEDSSVKSLPKVHEKKYQCNKCKQIFEQLFAFKQHTVSHRHANMCKISGTVYFRCTECGKKLKNQEKFEQHCHGHGNPDLECDKCHKVFASKFTLRNHREIHSRKFPCNNCVKSYATAHALRAHSAKAHSTFICELCPFFCESFFELTAHQEIHKSSCSSSSSDASSETDLAEGLFMVSDISMSEDIVKKEEEERVHTADSVIAKVMSNKIFTANNKNTKRQSRINKTCEVCHKKFDRVGDLKRHLIEHVIRSTLSKNPVNKFGVLEIRCEICQEKVFNKVDRYKAHLREHAKLTLYKCTFCDKSFSDSSNFSKHKKVHGNTYFQCDMCHRKFNSKKMLSQHMEYHMKTRPMNCRICDKVFYFESMLNKHIKYSHKAMTSKYRCRFCQTYYRSLREKWDHEWIVHKVRKVIVDCLVCGGRFRKYAELKRHCIDEHDAVIPPATSILKWKIKNKLRLIED